MSSVLVKTPSANMVKRKAAQEFTRRLIGSEIGQNIACIILFGSVVRDEAHPESDVDILVFGDKIYPSQTDAIADIAWNTTITTDEFIAPMAYNLSDLIEPQNYLIFDATCHGVELYRMEETQIRRLEAQNLYRKAEIHLDEAKRALSQQAFHLALVGAYTSAELAAKALIYLKPDVDIPSKHGSVVRIFGREYVLTGEVPAAWGRSLNRELESRTRALYDTTNIIDNSAKPAAVIELAQEMLAYLGEKLSIEPAS
ncbi:MAG: HEPN domain-containing protein [Chloroflexota bacterium]|nr:HEPN domain-containing protein [Chloroflexota bacterium]